MKINISIFPHSMSSYKNLSPSLGHNILKLDYINDAECTEILADDILDFIPYTIFDDVLNNYVSKLRHKSKIIIGGTDFIEVYKMYHLKLLDTRQLNEVLYGKQDHAWGFKRNICSLHELCERLENLGLKVMKKRLDGYKMVAEAIRE